MNLLYVLYFWIYKSVTGCDFFFLGICYNVYLWIYVVQKQIMKNVKGKASCDFFLFEKCFMDV